MMHELGIDCSDEELEWLVANLDRLVGKVTMSSPFPDEILMARLARAAKDHKATHGATVPARVADLLRTGGQVGAIRIDTDGAHPADFGALGRVLSRAFRGPRISWREVDPMTWEGVCEGHQFRAEQAGDIYLWKHYGAEGDVVPIRTGRTLVLEKAMDDALASFKRFEAEQREEAAKLNATLAGDPITDEVRQAVADAVAGGDPAVISFGDDGVARLVADTPDGMLFDMDLGRLFEAMRAADEHTAETEATGERAGDEAEQRQRIGGASLHDDTDVGLGDAPVETVWIDFPADGEAI